MTFDTAGDGLASRGGGPVRGFAMAGADGKYLYADAAIEGDAVVLRSDGVPAPKTVRYAWAGVPDATLANRSGLPAAPFRTDALPPAGRGRPAAAGRPPRPDESVRGDGRRDRVGDEPGRRRQAVPLERARGGRRDERPRVVRAPSLADVRDPGPGLVSCGDSEVTLLLEFGETGMEWAVTNRGKDGIKFRIALAPQVVVGGRGGPGR